MYRYINKSFIIFFFLVSFTLVSCSSKSIQNNTPKISAKPILPEKTDAASPQQPTPSKPTSTNSTPTQPNTKKEIISTYKTKFDQSQTSRVTNIKLAVKKINGHIIQPNETFSFNDTVGPTGPRRGFKPSTTFIKGKKVKGFGGGVCQVSTTLYNAANEVGLEIIERHPHSRDVHYVSEGKDAASAYGSVDLKIKNNKPYPISIDASIDGNQVIVKLKK